MFEFLWPGNLTDSLAFRFELQSCFPVKQYRIFPAGCRNEPLLQPVLRIRDTQMQADNQHWKLSVFKTLLILSLS